MSTYVRHGVKLKFISSMFQISIRNLLTLILPNLMSSINEIFLKTLPEFFNPGSNSIYFTNCVGFVVFGHSNNTFNNINSLQMSEKSPASNPLRYDHNSDE